MTVRLKSAYGFYPANTLLTTNPAEEARLLRNGQADTNLAAGVAYTAPTKTKWQTPVSLRTQAGVDELIADNRVVSSGGGGGGTTPLVNDLTTGGTAAALTAEQGKALANQVVAASAAAATAQANANTRVPMRDPVVLTAATMLYHDDHYGRDLVNQTSGAVTHTIATDAQAAAAGKQPWVIPDAIEMRVASGVASIATPNGKSIVYTTSSIGATCTGANAWDVGTTAVAPLRRVATCIIATADSSNKADADFVCTGTNDQTTINTALTQAIGKATKVVFRSGTYSLTDHIIVDTSHIQLEGEMYGFWGAYTGANGVNTFPRSSPGLPGGAKFVQNTAGKGVFRVGTNYTNDEGGRHKNITFKNLSLYGPSGTGVAIYDAVSNDICRVEGCNINGFGSGIVVSWDNPLIFNNNIQDTGNPAVTPSDSGAIGVFGYRGQIYKNVIYQVGGQGIWCGSYACKIEGNVIGLTRGNGILVTNAYVSVLGNTIGGPGAADPGHDNGDCIVLGNYPSGNLIQSQVKGCTITGNTLQMTNEDNEAQFPSGSTKCHGIRVGGDGGTVGGAANAACNYNSITGNTISHAGASGSSTGFAITLLNGSDYNAVVGNTVAGSAWNGGSATKINVGSGTHNQIGLNPM